MTQPQTNQAEAGNQGAQRRPSNHMLTILVDLSHPAFRDRGPTAQLRIVEVLRGCIRAAALGSEATLIEDGEGRAVGAYTIVGDDSGEGRAAFAAVVQGVRAFQNGEDGRRVQETTAAAEPETVLVRED